MVNQQRSSQPQREAENTFHAFQKYKRCKNKDIHKYKHIQSRCWQPQQEIANSLNNSKLVLFWNLNDETCTQ